LSETDLSRDIQRALAQLGVWCIRVQSGQHRVRGGVLHCAEPGTPDLLLPALNGWLEVKTQDGALEASQVAWHQRATREGVRVAVVRSVSEAIATAQQWRAGAGKPESQSATGERTRATQITRRLKSCQ
jgi:hypothetical protein